MPTSPGPLGRSATANNAPPPDTAAADPTVRLGPTRPHPHGSAGAARVVSRVYHPDAEFRSRRDLTYASTRTSTPPKSGVDRGVIGKPRPRRQGAVNRRNRCARRLLDRFLRGGFLNRRSAVRICPGTPSSLCARSPLDGFWRTLGWKGLSPAAVEMGLEGAPRGGNGCERWPEWWPGAVRRECAHQRREVPLDTPRI